MGPHLKGALFALAAFGLYSTHDVVIKFLGSDYSAFQIIFFSGLLSFPIVTTILMNDRRDGSLAPRHPWWSLLRALTAVTTGTGAFYAFSVLPLAQTYAILFAMPLLITLLAIPMLGEKVGIRRGIAVVIGLLGVMVVLQPGTAPLSWGHLAALMAAVTGSINSLIVRKIGGDERSAVLILYPMVGSVLATGAMMPVFYVPMPFEHLALMGVIATLGLIAAYLIILAYKIAPAIIVAPMQYSQILWAAVYGAVFFDENVDVNTVIGSSIIIASGIYIVLREGTPDVSKNSPVLSNKSRPETGILPRISLLLRRGEG